MMRRIVILTAFLPTILAAESVQRAYLERVAHADFRWLTAMNGLEGQVARLQLGLPIDPNVFDAALAFIATGDDMVDFTLSSLMRILYQYPSRIPPELKSRMERAVLDFRYCNSRLESKDTFGFTCNHMS